VFIDHEYDGAALPHVAFSLMSHDGKTQVQPFCKAGACTTPAQAHNGASVLCALGSSALAPLRHALAQLRCLGAARASRLEGIGCMPKGRCEATCIARLVCFSTSSSQECRLVVLGTHNAHRLPKQWRERGRCAERATRALRGAPAALAAVSAAGMLF
jgi:hypothetical protein